MDTSDATVSDTVKKSFLIDSFYGTISTELPNVLYLQTLVHWEFRSLGEKNLVLF